MSILSVQSCVVYGHVGNSAAVYPLQSLGLDVWAAPTVLYSGHVGRPGWRGRVSPPDELRDLIEGLDQHGALTRCEAVISGYLGSAENAEALTWILDRVRARAPHVRWICDPVIGDHGRVYVTDALAAAYRDAPHLHTPDLMVPNAFELAYLSSAPVVDTASALVAARCLIDRGARAVIGKGLPLQHNDLWTQHLIACDADGAAWRLETPHVPGKFVGTGDLFTALVTAASLRGADLGEAAQLAAAGTLRAIERTRDADDARDTLQLVGHHRWLDGDPRVRCIRLS